MFTVISTMLLLMQSTDDLVVMRRVIAPPRPVATQAPPVVATLVNGGFEDGLRGWTASSRVSAGPTRAGSLTVQLPTNDYVEQSINSAPGKQYQVQLWAYSTSGNPPYLAINNGSTEIAGLSLRGSSGNYGWKQFSLSFTGTGGQLTIRISNPKGLTPAIDDVTLIQ
jgi:hypothetical protein